MAIAATLWTLALCGAAVVAHHQARPVAYAVCKVLASVGFLAVALSAGLPDGDWHIAVVVGLVAALCGDALLAVPGSRTFIAGMLCFLVMHAAYLTAFVVRGVRPASLLAGGAVAVALTTAVWRWARPHLPARLRPAIAVYMLLLACDLAAGISTGVAVPAPLLALGVLYLCVSDIAVVRQRFITPGLVNKLIGLPLYCAGQLLISCAVLTLV